ncbi:MAG: CPBP family intramembrane glutamic endopeptidase [Acidobacteriota bacterium]
MTPFDRPDLPSFEERGTVPVGADPADGGPDGSHPAPRPWEGFFILVVAGTLFWGGAVAARGGPLLFLLAVLPLLSFVAPVLVWGWLRGQIPSFFPARHVTARGLAQALTLAAGGSLAALALAGALSALPGAKGEEAALRGLLGGFPPAAQLLLFALLPALSEEVLFRGALLSALRSWGALPACLASGFLFGFFHGSILRFAPVALLGTVLAAVVWRTGNLWVAVGCHALHNAAILWVLDETAGGSARAPSALLLAVAGGVGIVLLSAGLRGFGAGASDDEGRSGSKSQSEDGMQERGTGVERATREAAPRSKPDLGTDTDEPPGTRFPS